MLNVKYDWYDSSLSIETSVEAPPIKSTKDTVAEAVLKMKESKACGSSEIATDMVKAAGDAMLSQV